MEEAQTESAPEAPAEPPPAEVTPESFNIFSEGPSPVQQVETGQVAEEKPKKSKQFLENLKRDKELRQAAISLKQKQAQIAAKEEEVNALISAKENLRSNPEEFLRSQGIDPMQYYREWTERMINTDGQPSVESQLVSTQQEVDQLRNHIQTKEQKETEAAGNQQRMAAYNNLCSQVESYATSHDGYETIKESCTARDIVNGMVTHYKQTGEELTIEEAFEKIETGLREREESFYKDPKIVAKLQRYNPEAARTARGPQATLSAKWKEQPTRTDPEDMSYEEIRDHWKGKLFT